MNKSAILSVIGTLLVVGGAIQLVSPATARDAIWLVSSVWLFASGIGILLRRTWGLWLYFAGFATMIALTVVNSLRYGNAELSQALLNGAVVAAIFCVPAILIWIRRDRLQAGFWRGADA